MPRKLLIADSYSSANDATLWRGSCVDMLSGLSTGCAQLVLTSPPYNIGKEYESNESMDSYLDFQDEVIKECVRICRDGGSICWQVGNHVSRAGEVLPLDIALYPLFAKHRCLKLRNRIVWQYHHGLNCRNRFSGRHETVLWFSKGDDYLFNLDAVRVPQKYPGKRSYRKANHGEPTCDPRGKNPGDVWDIPNVKGNHVEKTTHPCQFPIALAETLILATTNRRHLVVDPFVGAGTTLVAAVKNGRRGAGADLRSDYLRITRRRLRQLEVGELPYRERLKPIHSPKPNTSLTTFPTGQDAA